MNEPDHGAMNCQMMQIPRRQLVLMERKRRRRKVFVAAEDAKLIHLVGGEQFPNWSEIGQQMPGRTTRQCRERYQHYLAPGIAQTPWTQEEDDLIVELWKAHGPNWALIAGCLEGRRTNNYVKNRWYNHLRRRATDGSEDVVGAKKDERSNAEGTAEDVLLQYSKLSSDDE